MSNFIGQTQIIDYLTKAHSDGKFPRLLILMGSKHWGKKTLATYIANNILNSQPTETGTSIDDVRDVIKAAYTATATTAYVFGDCDNMSTAALNAMLKVVEEPPRKAYFILTASEPILDTLHSRSITLFLQVYQEDELKMFTSDAALLRAASSPGEVKQFEENPEILPFCEKVYSSLTEVTGTNALKIGSYLKYKEEDEGYDVQLFLLGMRAVVHSDLVSWLESGALEAYSKRFAIYQFQTAKAFRKVQRKGVNKAAIIDQWILNIRRELMD